jgi:(p)ppGpp synthase/HD superfamily hydrolase
MMMSFRDTLRYRFENAQLIVKAIGWAFIAHWGQWYGSYLPYFWHPVEVLLQLRHIIREKYGHSLFSFVHTREICATLLHDVVEDTPTTVLDIRSNFNALISCTVDRLTRKDSQTYQVYITYIGLNPSASLIKIADLEVNLRNARRKKSYASLVPRYEKALAYLRLIVFQN